MKKMMAALIIGLFASTFGISSYAEEAYAGGDAPKKEAKPKKGSKKGSKKSEGSSKNDGDRK